jgi:hypothetical protein
MNAKVTDEQYSAGSKSTGNVIVKLCPEKSGQLKIPHSYGGVMVGYGLTFFTGKIMLASS